MDFILEYGRRYIVPVLERASARAKELRVTEDPSALTLFGEYDPSAQVFVWKNGMNRRLPRGSGSVFRDIPAMSRLWKTRVPLPPAYVDVIPFLMKILHPDLHVLYASQGDRELFYLVRLPLKGHLPMDVLEEALVVYRMGRTIPKTRSKPKTSSKPKPKTKKKVAKRM